MTVKFDTLIILFKSCCTCIVFNLRMALPFPTPYRISTITATGSVNTEIDLDVFYDSLRIIDGEATDQNGILYAEYGKKKSDTVYKGTSKKTQHSKRSIANNATDKDAITTKRFDNQVTIVYRLADTTVVSPKNALNVKIFKNGNIQITGIKHIDQGRKMIDVIIKILIDMYDAGNHTVVLDKNQLKNINYTIRLINSDFKIGFPVKREFLYRVFVSEYENDCCFEPCIYPGVKIRYFFNTNNISKDGICHCNKHCEIGKGSGSGDGNCKKITVAVFQSGCVIITGAQSNDQIEEAYTFIRDVLLQNKDCIEKKVIVCDQINTEKEKPKHIIKKTSIVYPDWWTQHV